MRLKERGGALESRQLSACVPPPNRRDMKLSSGLFFPGLLHSGGRGSDSWCVLERVHAHGFFRLCFVLLTLEGF